MVKQQHNTPPPQTTLKPVEEKRYSTVRLSEVMEAGLRLEASVYNVAARNAVQALRNAGLSLIPIYGEGGLCKEAHNAFRFRRVFVKSDRGVAFLSSSEIISMRPRAERFISRKQTPKLGELLVRKWDVMISCSGTIGNVALAGETFKDKALSQDAIRLRASDAETSGFIAAFLRSGFGRAQMQQATYGSVIVHIEPEHLTRMLIPDVSPIRRIAIGTLMLEATELRDRANNLLDDADQLLHERLRLPPLGNSLSDGPLITRIRASRWDGRLEASYHSPMAIKALQRLKRLKIPIATLGDHEVSKEVRAVTKFRKRVYVRRGGIPMYNSKQLFQVDPIDVKHLAKGAHTKDLPEISLAENMITVSRSGTIGRVQIIPAYMKDWTANEHNDRLIAAPGMNAGYIYAWLDSDYGYCLVTRHSYGSVIQEIDLEMLESVPIPMLDANERNEIGNLVLQGNALRDQAWQKEQEAIRQIDSLVEI